MIGPVLPTAIQVIDAPSPPLVVEVEVPSAIQVIEAQLEPLELHLIVPGKQGVSGAPAYVHNQGSASTQWTINHNLGYRPAVTVFNAGSQEITAEVAHPTVNQCIVYVNPSLSGFARLL